MILVVDLDDTLYDVQSIGLEEYAPALVDVDTYLARLPASGRDEFYYQFRHFAFSHVAKNFDLPQQLIDSYYDGLRSIDFTFQIKVFDDYPHLLKLDCTRILLTTGIPNIQLAKINALEIAADFHEILIDDPSVKPRISKWEHLLQITGRYEEKIWVIGDNPEAELQAAKSLGLSTIQRLKSDVPCADVADHCIHSFRELPEIIK